MPSFTCTGNGEEHCCVLAGVTCPFLEEDTVPGRRWTCGLLRRYGSWAGVHTSDEYQQVGDHWVAEGSPFTYCGDFVPPPGVCCRAGDG